jgi:3-hydroxyacyl-[acyl-carrier-protein] dehydratase
VRWIWIDQIVEFEPGRRMVAIRNVSRAEEYFQDHLAADEAGNWLPVMPACFMIEGMAQTAGVLVGTMRRFEEKVILAKVALARFDLDVFPGQTIRYVAELERMDRAGASTRGSVQRMVHPRTDWEPVGEVNLMFSHLDQNISGLEFPEENFVFSDNFKSLLTDAGLLELAGDSPAG